MLRSITICFLFSIGCFINSCPGNNVDLVNQSIPLYKFYMAHNWVPLPEPDSRFSPGAVFMTDPNGEISWQGTLADCGVPNDLLVPVPGESGKLTIDVNNDYGAKAVLQLKGIKAGPEWNKVKTSNMALDDHGATSINMINLRKWFEDPGNKDKIPVTCKKWLNMPGYYVARESYYVSKGSFTLKNQHGVAVSISGLQAGPVSIDPEAHVKTEKNGSLTFDQTLYTAVRRLAYTSGDWTTMGQPTASADLDKDLLNKLSYVKPKTN